MGFSKSVEVANKSREIRIEEFSRVRKGKAASLKKGNSEREIEGVQDEWKYFQKQVKFVEWKKIMGKAKEEVANDGGKNWVLLIKR